MKTNRRSFFQSLALGLAAAPTVLKAATTYKRTWHVPAGKLIAIPNPEYLTAPFEVCYWFDPSGNGTLIADPTPIRLRMTPEGRMERVSPFITQATS